jgi:hypothetical protein
MLFFNVSINDVFASSFNVILQIPTQAGEASPRWATQPGMLSFLGGPVAIAASPAVNRGTVLCTGIDSDGNSWPAVELDQVFTQFSRTADGSYAMLTANQRGTGQLFPDTVVSLHAGPLHWWLSPALPSP